MFERETALDMRNIASDDSLTSLVTDYFVTRQIGNTVDDSESVNPIRVMMLTSIRRLLTS